MKVSIIIPCANINSQTRKCIRKCLELDYYDFEILVLPDEFDKKSRHRNLKIIPTGKVKPALKRNIAMEIAKGELFAFIDDDAYPEKNWLTNAVKYFGDHSIGLVGGPNLTPPESNFAEHISGYVLSNEFVSGQAAIRYKISRNQISKELPSCNYISRDLGIKYDSHFLTAEDSKYCFDVWKKGYKVFYAGDVVVRHHRRDTLWKHIKQMYIYSRDIAWLTKRDFSFDKLYYAIPSLGLILFLLGLIGIYYGIYGETIQMIFAIYLLTLALTSLKKNLLSSIVTFLVSVATHFAYGFGWISGMISRQEADEKVIWNSR